MNTKVGNNRASTQSARHFSRHRLTDKQWRSFMSHQVQHSKLCILPTESRSLIFKSLRKSSKYFPIL